MEPSSPWRGVVPQKGVNEGNSIRATAIYTRFEQLESCIACLETVVTGAAKRHRNFVFV